jgi:iron(III) transport system substrate-binding protein
MVAKKNFWHRLLGEFIAVKSSACIMRISALAVFALLAVGIAPVVAAGSLVIYCGMQEEWCRAASTAFQQKTGIAVSMTRQSAGEIYARLKAEKDNPRGDIWYGGTGDPHLLAANDGLTEPYQSPQLGTLYDWASRQAELSKFRTVGIYLGALGYGYNTGEIASRKLDAPACWSDLLKADYKGEIQVADPNSSGTAYTMLATLVQLMGEEPAFDYFKKLHGNVDHYTTSGAAPAQAAGRGEVAVAIAFQHDLIAAAKKGGKLKTISPCEGTGYEIGSMSIVKGARNPAEAKQFYDWALTPEAQAIAAQNNQFQLPSNKATPVPPEAPDPAKLKLIVYDFDKYGSPAERNRLLARWTKDIKNAQ